MADVAARRLHHTLIGIGAMALAGALAWGASSIPSQAGYAGVGPNFLPWLVSIVLGLCGLLLVVQAQGAGWHMFEEPSGAERGDWPALAWIVGGLVFSATLLTTLGFILACSGCFMLAVRGLRVAEGRSAGGRYALLVDFVTGFLIAAPAFWLFTKVLGINLPGLTATGWL